MKIATDIKVSVYNSSNDYYFYFIFIFILFLLFEVRVIALLQWLLDWRSERLTVWMLNCVKTKYFDINIYLDISRYIKIYQVTKLVSFSLLSSICPIKKLLLLHTKTFLCGSKHVNTIKHVVYIANTINNRW